VLRKICESEPRDLRELNPAVPLWLLRLIERLLAKAPSRRFDSAAEVAALLEQCLAHVRQPATIALPDVLIDHCRRRRASPSAALVGIGRHRLAAAAVLLLLAAGLAAWAWQPPLARRAGGVSPLVQRSSASAPTARVDNAPRWEDEVDQNIALISADVGRLETDSADDLWNDSLAVRIEQLHNDVDDLKARTSRAPE
jgi:hypothetical protein